MRVLLGFVVVTCVCIVWLYDVVVWCGCIMWLYGVVVWCGCMVWLCVVVFASGDSGYSSTGEHHRDGISTWHSAAIPGDADGSGRVGRGVRHTHHRHGGGIGTGGESHLRQRVVVHR